MFNGNRQVMEENNVTRKFGMRGSNLCLLQFHRYGEGLVFLYLKSGFLLTVNMYKDLAGRKAVDLLNTGFQEIPLKLEVLCC